jgi:DNA polymerase
MTNATHFQQLISQLRHTLQTMAHYGRSGFDCSPHTLEILLQWGKSSSPDRESLADIRRDLGDCQRCELARHRSQIVFGAGACRSRIVFVGEAPGYNEDKQGLPFVGAAGKLLTRIIQSINLEREQVYICNIIKCRPPENRNPLPEEIAACAPFVARQIQAINPDYVCALGKFAAQTLLNSQQPISRLRGRFHPYGTIKLLPTFHPAFLLHNPERKRDVWEDMKLLISDMAADR